MARLDKHGSAIPDFLIQAGLWLAAFCAACGGLAALGLLCGLRISGGIVGLALAAACAAAWNRGLRAGWGIGLGGLLVSLALSLGLYDLSWDGQGYHQEAVDHLANRGWNPVWRPETDSPYQKWIGHYGKVSWYYAAVVYRATGRIEAGKSINPAMAGAAFCLWTGLLMRRKANAGLSVFLASAAAFNPVVSVQLFTFYVDGLVASSGLVLLAGFELLWGARDARRGWAAIACGTLLLANAKFTGLVLAGVFSACALAGMATWRRRRGTFRRVLFQREVAGFAAVFLLALAVGANPYATNTLRNGNPFHPLTWSNRRTFVEKNAPTVMQDPELGVFRKGVRSHFSASTNDKNAPARLKNPFRIHRREFEAFLCPDARIGGFGPLFPACVAFGLGAFGWGWLRAGRAARHGAAFFVLAAFASVAINSEWWWARYAPQLWWLPCACGAWGLLLPDAGRGPRLLGGIAATGMWAGAAAALAVSLCGWVVPGTRDLRAQLDRLRPCATVEIAFDSQGPFFSNRLRLTEAGVRFSIADALPEPAERLVYSTTRVQATGAAGK